MKPLRLQTYASVVTLLGLNEVLETQVCIKVVFNTHIYGNPFTAVDFVSRKLSCTVALRLFPDRLFPDGQFLELVITQTIALADMFPNHSIDIYTYPVILERPTLNCVVDSNIFSKIIFLKECFKCLKYFKVECCNPSVTKC